MSSFETEQKSIYCFTKVELSNFDSKWLFEKYSIFKKTTTFENKFEVTWVPVQSGSMHRRSNTKLLFIIRIWIFEMIIIKIKEN